MNISDLNENQIFQFFLKRNSYINRNIKRWKKKSKACDFLDTYTCSNYNSFEKQIKKMQEQYKAKIIKA